MPLRPPASDRPHDLASRFVPMLLLFVVYLATAKLGIALPVGEGVVTPVWAPTGIALAALTLYGWRLWPAVFAAALVANAMSGVSVALASGIAVGNTSQAIIGAWLLHRFSFSPALDRTRDVVALVAAALVSCLASATNGTTWLWLSNVVAGADYASRWMLWWFGDVMGVLVAGALLFAVVTFVRRRPQLDRRRFAEFALLVALLIIVSFAAFVDDAWRYPQLLFPLWVWAALRFRALGSTVATLVIGAIAVASTINGSVAVAGASATQTVQLLQAVLAIVGLSALVIAAAMSERDTSQARLEAALLVEQDIANQLRTIDEMKDSLLAVVSHELRTPLTSILALSSMLQQRHATLDDGKRLEMYGHLTREARRLDTLLGDLLDLERLRLGLLEPRYEMVDVPELVRAAVARFESVRPTKVDLAPISIRADAAKVERIVDNLIGNAYKHTPVDRGVFVSVRAVDDGALIIVDDEGEGVPDELKLSIFEPFNRGSAALTHAPGTGIGLSLVAHFTQLHGGRAWVEDRAGGGASFRVFLPSAHT